MTRPNSPTDETGISRIPLAMTFEELLGGDDTPDETADEMIAAVRLSRDTPSDKESG